MSALDQFSQQRFPALAERLMILRRQHEERCRILWIGALANAFRDDELAVLRIEGHYLSRADEMALAAARNGPA